MTSFLVLGAGWQGFRDPPLRPPASSPSFALVATLLMVTVITGAAVAFFQSTRIERFVSRNYSDLARAQMAAEAGQAAAASLLRLTTSNDHFLIVLNTNRQLFAGNGSNQAVGSFAYLPLFTFTNELTNFSTNRAVITASNPVTNLGTSNTIVITQALPGGFTVTSPAVAWVNLTNTAGQTNARFAFWMEDLAGRIDLSVAGATNTNATRPTGTNPAELALWSLFNTATNLDVTNPNVGTLVANRSAILTPATAALVTSTVTTNHLPHLAAGLIHDTNEPELVPYGFGYPSNGQPKLNLNRAITAVNNLDLIAGQITNNLPNFTNRAGGMNGAAYVYALAANIIDYADGNSIATQTNVNSINILGFDNYPLLTHVFDEFLYSAVNRNITITTYLQFWNPSTLSTAQLSSGVFTYNFNDIVCYPTNPAGNQYTNLALTNSPIQGNFTFSYSTQTNYIFPPNSGFITSFQTVIDLSTFPNFPATGPDPIYLNATGDQTSAQSTQTNSYTLVVSSTTSSPAITINRYNRTLNSGTPNYIGHVLGLRVAGGTGTPPWRTADPRMTPYLGAGASSRYDECAFNSTYFQGYPAQTLESGPLYANPINWPDGRNTTNIPLPVRGNINLIPVPLGPFQIQDPVTLLSDPAPCKLSNNGSYLTVCELGNIFDPMQWAPPANLTNLANANITNSWTSNNLYGGGATLRIGRPEHSRFTNDGLRASQLLDLFTAGPRTTNGGITVLNSVPGRINLNTATTNTLRALAAGVLHTNDPNLATEMLGGAATAGGTNFVLLTNPVNAFVRGATHYRGVRPFFSPGQLATITNSTGTALWPSNAVFGNGRAGTVAGPLNVTWSDAAAEEWFSKVYPLCTVRSRNFLVVVVAQAMTTNTNTPSRPVATSRKAYQVYAEPIRNPTNGLTTNVNVRTVRSWSL